VTSVVDADPVAACVRDIMAERNSWTGSATDLLRAGANGSGDGISRAGAGWPKNPRALARRLRRAQTALRAIGIEIGFSREGRAGTRTIWMKPNVRNEDGADANSDLRSRCLSISLHDTGAP
jgi:hypothetical protein